MQDGLRQLGPIKDIQALTLSDVNAQAVPSGIMVSAAGNVAMRLVDGNADITLALLAGVVYPFAVKYVRSTGTSAITVYGLYN